jgi:TolA-binding protein
MYARGIVLLLVLTALPPNATRAQSNTAGDQYQLAAEHYNHQRWRLAATEFDAFLRDYASHRLVPSARFFRAESRLQTNDKLGALEDYRLYLKSGDGAYAGVAQFRAGETAFLLEQAEPATQHLQTYINQNPRGEMLGYALTYLGKLALARRDAVTAERRFGEALRRFANQPFSDECRFGLAKAYLALGNFDDAKRFFTFLEKSRRFGELSQLQLAVIQMETDQDSAAQRFLDLRASTSDQTIATQAAYWLGMLAHRKGEWSESARLLTSLNLGNTLGPSAAFAAAESLKQMGDLDGARTQLRRVIESWPSSGWGDDATQLLVSIEAEQKKYAELDKLVAAFTNQYEDSQLLPEVARIYGRALLEQNRLAEAATAFETTTPEQRSSSDWYHIGLVRLSRQEFKSALVALDRVALSEADTDEADTSEADAGERPSSKLRVATALAQATALVRLEQYQLATPRLREFLALQPEGPDADRCRAQLAVALATQQKWDEAKSVYDFLSQAQGTGSEFWSTTHYLADAAAARNDAVWSSKLYRNLADNGPTKPFQAAGLAGLAWLEIEGDSDNISDASINRLLEDHADSRLAPRTTLAHARALKSRKRSDEAIAAYTKVIDRFAESPEAPAALLEVSEILSGMGRHSEARSHLEQLTSQHPKFAKLATAHYLLAWVYADLGEAQESTRKFKQIVDEFPASHLWSDAAYRLAEQAAAAEQFAKVEAIASTITERNLDSRTTAHAWYLRGQVAAKLKRWEDVESYMQSALDLSYANDLYLPARYWRAESLYRQRRYEQASAEFDALIRLTSGRHDTWLGMLPLRRAQVMAHAKRWREAFDLAQTIRENFPDFSQLHEVDYLMGRCQGSWADFVSARDSYRRVVQSTSAAGTETASMAQWMIGETYFLQGNYADAIRAYHRVRRFPRWQAAALLQAAKGHLALRQHAEAAQLLDQLLSDFPDSPFADDARARRATLRVSTAPP